MAGIMIRNPIRRLTLGEWHRVIDTNSDRHFPAGACRRKAAAPLRAGAIVAIASTRALTVGARIPILFPPAKWRLCSPLTHRAGDASLGPERAGELRQPRPGSNHQDYGALRPQGPTPSIRPAGSAGPQDIAEIVAWLLDKERSGFVTGANFVVDGGMTRKELYLRGHEADALPLKHPLNRDTLRRRVGGVLTLTVFTVLAGFFKAQNAGLFHRRRSMFGFGRVGTTTHSPGSQCHHMIREFDPDVPPSTP